MFSTHDNEIPLRVENNPEDPESTVAGMTWYKGAREYFSEYCNNTSLHGFKYVGGEKRTVFEKCLWLTFLTIAVTGCSYLIKKTYDKWESSPVIVSFDHNPIPVWEIPFPAITICPQNKAKQTSHNFTEYATKSYHNNITEDELETFGKLLLVCDLLQIDKTEFYTEYENDNLLHFFMEAAPSIDDIMGSCKWNNEEVNCADWFVPTLNEDGICFTFNMLGDNDLFTGQAYHYNDFNRNVKYAGDWNLENGYGDTELLDSYPRRVVGAGIKQGFEVSLIADEEDLDYFCKSPVQGYKLLLHQAGDISRGRTQYLRIPLNKEVTVALQPHLITTAKNLKNYHPDKRKCYFDNEYRLQFFQRYSQANCELECVTNATLDKCGCVAYYMPRNEFTKICGIRKHSCVRDVEDSLMFKLHLDGKREFACGCMPSCFSLSYGAETVQSDLAFSEFCNMAYIVTGLEEFKQDQHKYFSNAKIFYKEAQFIATERSELYGITDFLSNCGGIFGLFTGFSILSLMEIIYYLTCRAWINKHWFGRYLMETPENPKKFRRNKCAF